MDPRWHLLIFFGAQIVIGILGYWQGRKDEALVWHERERERVRRRMRGES
jgi:hypothetical protein